MSEITIQASPWTLEAAASILKAFADRGPSSDREELFRIADEMQHVANLARAETDD